LSDEIWQLTGQPTVIVYPITSYDFFTTLISATQYAITKRSEGKQPSYKTDAIGIKVL